MLLMHLVSQKKTRDGISKKAKIGRNINCWASTSPSWAQGGILLLLMEVIPWLPPGRISCASQAPSDACSQLWARAPWQSAAGCGKPQTQSKILTWQKEDASALKSAEGVGQGWRAPLGAETSASCARGRRGSVLPQGCW